MCTVIIRIDYSVAGTSTLQFIKEQKILGFNYKEFVLELYFTLKCVLHGSS